MGLAPSEARDGRIKIHGPEAFEGMRRAGMLAAETLDFITPHARPGITTGELDRLCHGFILDHEAIPAPLNYRGFPKSICTSINHVVCHGIPGERRLMEGDILNIDVTPILDGWHGDSSRMFLVGERIPVKLIDGAQRTALLKSAGAKGGLRGPAREAMTATLDAWDGQLARAGAPLLAGRIRLVAAIRPLVTAAYEAVSGGPAGESTGISYRASAFNNSGPDEDRKSVV